MLLKSCLLLSFFEIEPSLVSFKVVFVKFIKAIIISSNVLHDNLVKQSTLTLERRYSSHTFRYGYLVTT